MTSESTKRRKTRDAALMRKWAGTPVGTRVTIHRANGRTLQTVTLCEPFALHAGAYVRVQGIDGNTHLRRITRGWDAASEPTYAADRLPWNTRAEKELQRLRAAMVHAMDDCEHAVRAGANGRALALIVASHAALKTALEKK